MQFVEQLPKLGSSTSQRFSKDVNQGESLLTIHAHDKNSAKEAEAVLLGSFEFSEAEPEKTKLIRGIVK